MKSNQIYSFAKDWRMVIVILLYIAINLLLAVNSGADIVLVFMGTSPILVFLIAVYLLKSVKDVNPVFFWVMPLVFPILFLILWMQSESPMIKGMDGESLFVFDIFVSYLFNLIIMTRHTGVKRVHIIKEKIINKGSAKQDANSKILIEKNHYYKEQITQLEEKLLLAQSEIIITKNNFKTNLKSIEDKCKAINFVIGRVYSNKKGGSPSIRNRIKIKSEWYNEFSELSAKFSAKKAVHLFYILEKILNRILLLESREVSIFKLHPKPKIKLQRNDDNKEKILTILIANDKDPISDYHGECKEICEKLLRFIESEYFKKER